MARVRYLGWLNRDSPNSINGGGQLRKSIHHNGKRLVFRGRAGKPSQWRSVEDPEVVEAFESDDEFEVDRE